MTIEQFVVLALLVLVPLLNALIRFLRKRVPVPPPADAKAKEPVLALPPSAREGPAPPEPPRPSVRAPTAQPAAVRRVSRRSSARRLRPADVRRGIVLMTILRPCRALEGRPAMNSGAEPGVR